ncbi:Protein fmp52, mitochondrial [Orbilia javanica]|uniref:Protein fmp52, mitochondrial n=1 Tax=Orbilia javanica TaxID=47235 RepID=A0AAN8MV98_9PEZI
MTSTFALLGATGLVGSNILKYLIQSPTPSTIVTLTRRNHDEATISSAAAANHTLTAKIEKDTAQWATIFGEACKMSPPPIAFTAMGTTRAAAGGFDKQYALEHDVNVAVAKAAKEAGVKTFVLISSSWANKDSNVGYTKMKGEIEQHIQEFEFEKFIIVRPGLLLGPRNDSRLAEGLLQVIAKGLRSVSGGALSDSWAQGGDVVARAAVRAALDENIKGTKILYQNDIVELGKTEGW